jgi:hypothetical protein
MMRKLFAAVAMLPLALATGARADRIEIALGEPQVITSETQVARVLFAAPDLSGLDDSLLFSARLEFALGAPAEEEVYVQVNPITREWTPGSASWTSPWTRPGGDRDEDHFRTERVDAGDTALTVDVTSILRAALEGEIEAHGFVLSAPHASGDGLAAAELSRLGSLAAGKLVVEHRKFRTPRAARERAQG